MLHKSDIAYIEQTVDKLIKAYDIEIPILDIDNLIEIFGGKIIERKNFAMGTLSKKTENNFVIAIFPDDNLIRRKIDLVRELGYLFLCLGFRMNSSTWESVPLNRFYSFNDLNKYTMADYFTRCFLMPKKEFIDAFQKYHGYIDDIANYFQVSKFLVINRTKDLDLKY